jgi:hypothetical protein
MFRILCRGIGNLSDSQLADKMTVAAPTGRGWYGWIAELAWRAT